jgi:hypothetical protein
MKASCLQAPERLHRFRHCSRAESERIWKA